MPGDQPTMQYYDRDGKRVPEGDPRASSQYLSDDPARPDAKTPADQAPEPAASEQTTKPKK